MTVPAAAPIPAWSATDLFFWPGSHSEKTTGRRHLVRAPFGGAIVRAYTDLKRHDLCGATDQFFCNERIAQAGISTREFLTRKLWDVGNSAPYGHRGDLTTLTEAIDHHHGEAKSSRDTFFSLSMTQQAAVIEFLKTLQVLPPGSPLRIPEPALPGRIGVR